MLFLIPLQVVFSHCMLNFLQLWESNDCVRMTGLKEPQQKCNMKILFCLEHYCNYINFDFLIS